jgi:hypothetical protein
VEQTGAGGNIPLKSDLLFLTAFCAAGYEKGRLTVCPCKEFSGFSAAYTAVNSAVCSTGTAEHAEKCKRKKNGTLKTTDSHIELQFVNR